MRKRRFRQANYATEAEILAINSKAVREDLYIATDTNKAYWIDHDGSPQLISGGVGGANLSVGGITGTTLDIQSDTGTNATVPSATSFNAGLMSALDKLKLNGTETSSQLNTRDTNNRKRSNHTGTQTASTISNFDTEVSNNASVTANTAKVSASGSINTHSDVNTSGASAGDRLIYDGSDWVPYTRYNTFFRNGAAGNALNIGATKKVLQIPFAVLGYGPGFSSSDGGESITIQNAGNYSIDVFATFNDTSNTGRVGLSIMIEEWSGSSWSNIAGLREQITYIRGTGEESHVSTGALYVASTNSKIRVVAYVKTGISTSVFQVGNGTNVKIIQIS